MCRRGLSLAELSAFAYRVLWALFASAWRAVKSGLFAFHCKVCVPWETRVGGGEGKAVAIVGSGTCKFSLLGPCCSLMLKVCGKQAATEQGLLGQTAGTPKAAQQEQTAGTSKAAKQKHTQCTCMACARQLVGYEAALVFLILLTSSGPSSLSEAHASKLAASLCTCTFLPIVVTVGSFQECVIVGHCCSNTAVLVLVRCKKHPTKLSADHFEHNCNNIKL